MIRARPKSNSSSLSEVVRAEQYRQRPQRNLAAAFAFHMSFKLALEVPMDLPGLAVRFRPLERTRAADRLGAARIALRLKIQAPPARFELTTY